MNSDKKARRPVHGMCMTYFFIFLSRIHNSLTIDAAGSRGWEVFGGGADYEHVTASASREFLCLGR
jgi:hypothetical protein